VCIREEGMKGIGLRQGQTTTYWGGSGKNTEGMVLGCVNVQEPEEDEKILRTYIWSKDGLGVNGNGES